MKIYHTERQEDYDALMVELESKGIQTLKEHNWKEYENRTVVFVRAIGRDHNSDRTDTTYGSVAWSICNYPRFPIIKYKAELLQLIKQGERGRLT